jgi:replication factor A1
MRQSAKNYYIGCPKCKKKVAEVDAAVCVHCSTPYDEAQFRYVLSLNLADYTDSLWVNAYDEAGEALLGISARVMAGMKEEEIQEQIKKIRYRHRKVRMVTKNEEFNGAVRKKTTVIRVIDINFAEETKNLLEKVASLVKN